MKLFLDDFRKPSDVTWGGAKTYELGGWYTVDTATKFVSLVDELTSENMPQVISFDHDLLDEHYEPGKNWKDLIVYEGKEFEGVNNWTGFHCAEYFIEHLLKHDITPPIMYCHSLNQQGTRNIERIWNKYIDIYFDKHIINDNKHEKI